MMAAMEAAQRQAHTNEDSISVDGDPSAGASAARPAPAPAATPEEQATVADVFAAMMARAAQQRPTMPPIGLPPVRTAPRHDMVGRNDPCPCGSGKKYKKCCGRNMV